MLKDKKAVIFDLDGTLVDSMGVWSQIDIEYLGARGWKVPEDLQRELEGMSFTETAAYFKRRFSLEDTVEEIKKSWQAMAMDKYRYQVPLKPGVKRFLHYLESRGIKMAVASSNDIELIRAVLESHGIDRYISWIVTSCEVKKGKPAPDVYLEAASRLGVEPCYCLVFEDIVPGIQAGIRAGMTTCAVEDSYSREQREAKKSLAHYYIDTYEEILPES